MRRLAVMWLIGLMVIGCGDGDGGTTNETDTGDVDVTADAVEADTGPDVGWQTAWGCQLAVCRTIKLSDDPPISESECADEMENRDYRTQEDLIAYCTSQGAKSHECEETVTQSQDCKNLPPS